MAKITAIDDNSIGKEIGLEVGDELLGFDGYPITDILDYLYYDEQEEFVMNIKSKQGEQVDVEIEKDVDERLGLTLDESVELNVMPCKNKCIFCFVDQLPKGMRDTLYVKDDDYRLSFVSGNYVTLTNVGDKELERIARLRLSPLYISVHCFDKETKKLMVANPHGAELFDKMQYLKNHGIQMHAQIVLCKGINDGDKLKETLCRLYDLRPNLLSVAIIPVGLSAHRKGLYELQPIDRECARQVISDVESFDKHVGGGFCYCSDEFYLKAELPLPDFESYGDFGQIENGVGLVAQFEREFDNALAAAQPTDKEIRLDFITGKSFCDILKGLLGKAKSKFINLNYRIYDVRNDHFGPSITVAGLITAKDIIAQVQQPCGKVVIPANMLREFTTTFLDGMSLQELSERLNSKIYVSGGGGDIIKILSEVADE
ncbi:MAG: DUF512 domain-containing protein [Christensenellales bacterium]